MYPFNPMRVLPKTDLNSNLKINSKTNVSDVTGNMNTITDTLVIFGEVFQRGYVNGMIEEAERLGINVVYTTVGRRDENNKLRPLTSIEIDEKNQFPLINIPLEAGFDLIPWNDGMTLVDKLLPYKMSQWKDIKIDFKELDQIIEKSNLDFSNRSADFVIELIKIIPKNGNIIFAHTMAGGIPRAKIVMPTMNRIFKGSGDRFESSEEFVNTTLGEICMKSFDEVTANTFQILIDVTANLRTEREKNGFKVGYTAFGYHGCDALVDNKYIWQSYAPYLQGWAKIKLENIAIQSFENNIQASVFNAPEILTNSSSVFLGVEVCLYPLLSALKKEGLTTTHKVFKECQQKLKDGYSLSQIEDYVQDYLNSDIAQVLTQFETWPHHNLPEQMEKMKLASSELINMHKDPKDLITSNLSELVFKACGALMIHEVLDLKAPVWWIGHDIVAKWTAEGKNK